MGSAQTNSVVNVGGPTTTTPFGGGVVPRTDLLSMITLAGGGTAFGGNFGMLCSQNSPTVSAANYQVSSGKKFVAYGFAVTGAAITGHFQFCYGTAALSGNNTGTPPAGLVRYGTTDGGFELPSPTDGPYTWFSLPISFPSLSFPIFTAQSAGNFSVYLIGEEI